MRKSNSKVVRVSRRAWAAVKAAAENEPHPAPTVVEMFDRIIATHRTTRDLYSVMRQVEVERGGV